MTDWAIGAKTRGQSASLLPPILALAYPFLLQGFNVAYIVVAVADNRSPIKLTAKGAPAWLRCGFESVVGGSSVRNCRGGGSRHDG
jgi:hypothetical protein